MNLAETRVTVVGLGLMGGSLAGALAQKNLCAQLAGVARRAETCRQAEAMGLVQWATTDLAAGVEDADLVILAIPARAILDLLPRVGAAASPGTVILDVGSTKEAICQAMDRLPVSLEPVGGHPMCGLERNGLDAARQDLYAGAAFVVAPLPRTGAAALRLVEELVVAIGAHPVRMAPDRHDELVAAVSHLPYLLAVTLVRQVAGLGRNDPLVWELASSGFRDTSRLAGSGETMMMDILMTNRERLLRLLRGAEEELRLVSTMLEREDEEGLREALSEAGKERREWNQ